MTKMGKTIWKKKKKYAIAIGYGNRRTLYGAGGRSYTFRTKKDAKASLRSMPTKRKNPRVVKIVKTLEGDVKYKGRWMR